jgi:hypothetical protein
MKYHEALKVWNEQMGHQGYCSPRKGTPEHAEVIAIQNKTKEAPKKAVNILKSVIKRKLTQPFEPENNILTKNEIILNDIENLVKSKSTRNINVFKKKYNNINLLKNLFGAEQYLDFYPTPQECLKKFTKNLKYVEKDEHILEPSAGVGSIIHYLQKQGYKNIEANDFDKNMTDFIKTHYNNVKITQEDFINKNYDNNNFSLIFCNPPFTLGNNKKFYIDFLFKCFDVIGKSTYKFEKNIYFICPSLTSKDNMIDFQDDIWSNLSKNKKNELLKKYNIDEDNIDMFLPLQTEMIGNCNIFGDTKINTILYVFTFVR